MANKICRITILAFLFGNIPKGDENGYNDYDLQNAIQYCEELIADGFKREPMDNFDLKEFIAWANKQIKITQNETIYGIRTETGEQRNGITDCL